MEQEPIEAGIYPDLSNDDYHADKAIGSSGLKCFAQVPAIYHYQYLSGLYERDETAASRFGTHAHIALLEPELFDKQFVVAPEMAVLNKGKKNEKTAPMNRVHADWKAFAAEVEETGKTPMLYSEYQRAKAMSEAIASHELARSMLTGGRAEMSFFAEDEETGLMMKARPDYLVTVKGVGNVLVDYKTTGLALGIEKQSYHAFSLGREIQAYHHKHVTELASKGVIAEVVYITQMQDAPYLVRVFRMPEEGLRIGEEKCRNFLNQIAECHDTGVWQGYPETIEDYTIPRWADYDNIN